MPRRLAPSVPARRRIFLLLFGLALLAAGSASAMGRWRSITPEGGSIQALAAAPGAGQIVYAVSFRGTVLRSSDGARTWSSRKAGLAKFVRELSVDPVDPDLLYANTSNGLLRSVDGGESWSRSLGYFQTYRVAPSDPKVLYAARDKEVLRSEDAGTSWTVVHLGKSITESLAVDPGDSRIIYVLGVEGIFRSDDAGASWANVTPVHPQGALVWIRALAVDPRQPSTLYAGEWGGEIFKSSDRGKTWSPLWEGSGLFVGLETLKVNPANGHIYAVFDEWKIFRSTDGGASWSQIFSGYRVTSLDLHSGTPRLYVGTTRGGVYLSEDAGQSWMPTNRGFQELAFVRVQADPHTPGQVFALADPELELSFGPGRPHILKTIDGGASWTSPFGTPDLSPYVNDLAADPSRPGTWYLACSGGVMKTWDGGEAWESVNQGLRSPWEYVAAIALAPSDPDALYAIGWHHFPLGNSPRDPKVRVFRSLDAAGQWRRSRVPRPDGGFLLVSLAVDPADASVVYTTGPGIFRSTDGGATWAKIGRGLRDAVGQVVVDPHTTGTLYAIVALKRGTRVFKSVDHGTTWAIAMTGVPSNVSVAQLASDPRSPGTLYAATTQGVYVTRDAGRLWTPLNDGLGDLPVFTVAVDPLQPEILYAGRADGLFRFSDESP
jgi:photosystem II stability/assembly factor-like uncharacterized protein